MKIIIEDKRLQSFRISRDFDILIDNKIKLTFNKYYLEDDYETDADYSFDDKSKKIFDKLTEEQQDEISDFINDININ